MVYLSGFVVRIRVRFIVSNFTFKNISFASWWTVCIGGENRRGTISKFNVKIFISLFKVT
jgi:hypothetical protein